MKGVECVLGQGVSSRDGSGHLQAPVQDGRRLTMDVIAVNDVRVEQSGS